jgi:hypothetical protein
VRLHVVQADTLPKKVGRTAVHAGSFVPLVRRSRLWRIPRMKSSSAFVAVPMWLDVP